MDLLPPLAGRQMGLEAGQLVAFGEMEEMNKQLRAHRLIQVRLLGELEPLQELLLHSEAVTSIMAGLDADLPSDTVRFDFGGDEAALSQLLTRIVTSDIPVVSFSEETGDLEDIFLHATRGIVS